MGYYLEGNGYQVDGVQFNMWLPTGATETEEAKPISRKCANCKCWFNQWPNDEPNLVDYFGVYVQICDYCAKEEGKDN